MSIGRIQRVPLRDVWKHEAHNFTLWLTDNLEVINEATGLNLVSGEREQAAGSFSVDIVAETGDGGRVVVENQLERSDHDHLGKLVTYLTAFDADAAVWIVADARPEHTAAMSWLNKSANANFYLLKAEAICIEDSKPALLLTRITGPSAEIKAVARERQEMSERDHLRLDFWTQLLDHANARTKIHSNISPRPYPWLSASAGHRGISFVYGIKQHSWSVFLYIDRGKDAEDQNAAIFHTLKSQQAAINTACGEQINFDEVETKRCSLISMPEKSGGYRDDADRWPAIHAEMVDAMIKFSNALTPKFGKAMAAVDALPPREDDTES